MIQYSKRQVMNINKIEKLLWLLLRKMEHY